MGKKALEELGEIKSCSAEIESFLLRFPQGQRSKKDPWGTAHLSPSGPGRSGDNNPNPWGKAATADVEDWEDRGGPVGKWLGGGLSASEASVATLGLLHWLDTVRVEGPAIRGGQRAAPAPERRLFEPLPQTHPAGRVTLTWRVSWSRRGPRATAPGAARPGPGSF